MGTANSGRDRRGERRVGLGLPASELPAVAAPMLSAVVVRLLPTADSLQVEALIAGWGDTSVFTREGQNTLLLQGMVDKARRQLGMFRILLTIIAGIIMALIIYTLTLDKLYSIALLKLIGASNLTILGLILQQALLLGCLGYPLAYGLGQRLFPYFPRRVVLANEDLAQLAAVVITISVASSLIGIVKALRVQPNSVLMG